VTRCKRTPESPPVEIVATPPVSEVEVVREKPGHGLAPRVDVARVKLAPYAATARESLEEAVDWAVPRVEEAREAVREKASTAATAVVPKVAAALGTAAAVGAPLAHEARERGEAALHALRGELPEPAAEEKARWPLALLFLLVGTAIGFVAGMFAKRNSAPPPAPYTDLGYREPVTPEPPVSQTPVPPIGEGQVGLDSEAGGVTDEPPPSTSGS
jgi:hypothetical protein